MISFKPCRPSDAAIINEIAHKSWWPTYGSFLSKEQIRFMLNELYEPNQLAKSMELGVGFLMVEDNQKAVGFISFTPKTGSSLIYRIEKLYLLEEAQGRGLGKALIDEVSIIAQKQGFTSLELNVNRYNPALSFYKKQGFSIVEEIDIPFHQFILNDYVMQKEI